MSEQQRYPWPEASATGVGSWPGTDPGEAVRTIVGELPELPHLPELPARGAGADMVGRTAAMLPEFPVEVQPSGWRVVQRPGRDTARARDFLSYDLDALEERAHAYSGPLKVQLAGPWTLAAAIELRGGEKLLKDPGAVRDLTEALVEAVGAHAREVRRRVPGAELVVQVDEPALPAALLGTVPTASGYGRLPAVERVTAEERLRAVFDAVAGAGAVPVAHCCARSVPIDLLRRSGARGIGLDTAWLTRASDEALGTAVEDGVGLFLGVVASTDQVLSDAAATVDPVRELWNRIGFAPELLARTVVTTPSCGLAGASPGHARAALTACRTAARVLRDEPRR
ncbi:methionine synthase [Marinitenerispora sediminis]|uniref:Methionine synthase n=1 Tax=Marinitenerispora sediminis TaxID=1931232 RepID=A0A368T4A3_9ACTN|nr:methionine synthase [Marinitenerispora sediminis]RCV51264.1 methionine synthase [Marinitenerispora sediminis]RCV55785.1 methionine synthase [Marinitenerispora sediminis]RCV57542.1 methionine synthase [Marinitenerispora sediminis]